MANRACGKRLSLRNQYDTKTPRASVLFVRPFYRSAFFRAARRPSREKPGHARVTNKIFSVGFEMSVENFFRKKAFEKFPWSSRITAGLTPREGSEVFLNVALGQGGCKPS
jgi:hypothetical protein